MSESSFIESIKKLIPLNTIGDDCALLQVSDFISKKEFSENVSLLVSTDTLIEETHFKLNYYSLQDVGYKALAVNISDIAACGGIPIFFSISITFPEKFNEKEILKIYKGFIPIVNKYNLLLSGGDVVRGDKLSITITIFGKSEKPLKRNTAKSGEYIYVTGEIGTSAYALHLLLKNMTVPKKILMKHLRPEPRIELIQNIKKKYNITSSIDISDGLSLDLSRLMHSNIGFEIDFDKIPVNKELKKEKDYIIDKCVLNGGEDFEILFTSSDIIREKFVYNIGRVNDLKKIILNRNNHTLEIKPSGYDHFKYKVVDD